MDILTDMMGMEVTYELWGKEASLPYYMTAGYEFKKAVIDGCPCLMLYAKEELPTLPAIKKQIARLQQLEAVPVVICVRTMSAFRRKSMIENKIPFVVLEKQVYLPFMGTFLQAKEDKTEKPIEHFMISSQLLCLLYLYQNEKKLYLSEAVKKLPYSAMTMTRAARQLEQSGIFQVEKEGVNKILTCEDTGSSLYKRMMTYMSSPVVKKGYLAKEHLSEEMVIAGTSALAEKSMLNRERVMDYAVFLEKQEADYLSDELIDPEKQILVEVWQYNPKLFARDGVADPVSVALSLREEKDERVEDTVEEMLENLWEELDGNGV